MYLNLPTNHAPVWGHARRAAAAASTMPLFVRSSVPVSAAGLNETARELYDACINQAWTLLLVSQGIVLHACAHTGGHQLRPFTADRLHPGSCAGQLCTGWCWSLGILLTVPVLLVLHLPGSRAADAAQGAGLLPAPAARPTESVTQTSARTAQSRMLTVHSLTAAVAT